MPLSFHFRFKEEIFVPSPLWYQAKQPEVVKCLLSQLCLLVESSFGVVHIQVDFLDLFEILTKVLLETTPISNLANE